MHGLSAKDHAAELGWVLDRLHADPRVYVAQGHESVAIQAETQGCKFIELASKNVVFLEDTTMPPVYLLAHHAQ